MISDVDSFSKKYSTYIIGYCPDTDEFFVTRHRHFYWESGRDFKTKEDAIGYFESNVQYFIHVKNHILMSCIQFYKPEDKVWLSNTDKWYYGKQIHRF